MSFNLLHVRQLKSNFERKRGWRETATVILIMLTETWQNTLSYDWTDSIVVLRDALDPGEAENTERIPLLETLVIQLRILLSRWELLAIVPASCTSICPTSNS